MRGVIILKSKGIFLFSCIVHVIALILLLILGKRVDVLGVFGFVFVPVLISLIICLWGQRRDNKNATTHVKNMGLKYCIPNIVYLSIASYMISKDIDEIYASSQKYQSEQLSVSVSNSPWFGFVILLVMTIVLHYAIANIVLKKSKIA
jgi:hypothetical protein